MPTYYRYSEDPTGTSPDNLVQGEIISLSTRALRFAIPKYAPFYSEGVQIFDALTQRLLIKGVDYTFPVLLKEATLRYGREVCDSIMVLNADVSSQIRVTYQCVGGDIQNNIDNVVKIYEAYANDNRMVDWVNVMDKPGEYPPSAHAHYLTEVFGFEPVAFELERIAQAIQLGNAPAFDAMIQAIRDQGVSEAEIDAGVKSSKFVSLERLMYALDKFDFNSVVMSPPQVKLKNGGSQWFAVKATKVDESSRYYWTIEHITTTSEDFAGTSGIVSLTLGEGKFMIQTVFDRDREGDETFKVALRRNGPTGPIVKTSATMTLSKHGDSNYDTILDALLTETISTPRVALTAKTYSVFMGACNATFD